MRRWLTWLAAFWLAIAPASADNLTLLGVSGGFSGPDNAEPAALAMFSVRRLLSSYTGYAMQVCLTATPTVCDNIDFTAAGDLDVSLLQSFCVTVSLCGVATWYDQSGNGNNAVQATTALRPKVALNVINGRPALLFASAASQWMATTNTFTFTVPFSFSAVSSQITTGSFALIMGVNDTTFFPTLGYTNTNPANVYVSSTAGTDLNSSNTFAAGAWTSAQGVFNNAASSLTVNGAAISGNAGTLNAEVGKTLTVGGQLFGNPLNGYLPEAIYFASAISAANAVALTAGQRAYFGF
jgi:Alpha-L-arabinofuranosidase B, catalytic